MLWMYTYLRIHLYINTPCYILCKYICKWLMYTYEWYECTHVWSGDGLQHLLGATKRAFSAGWFGSFCLGFCHFSEIFWNSDYRQRIPLKSTDIWKSRIHTLCVLSFFCNCKPSSLHLRICISTLWMYICKWLIYTYIMSWMYMYKLHMYKNNSSRYIMM